MQTLPGSVLYIKYTKYQGCQCGCLLQNDHHQEKERCPKLEELKPHWQAMGHIMLVGVGSQLDNHASSKYNATQHMGIPRFAQYHWVGMTCTLRPEIPLVVVHHTTRATCACVQH